MKDPLNHGSSLFELLQVPPETSPDEIKQLLIEKAPGPVAFEGVYKAFLMDYPGPALTRISPLLASRPEQLEPGQRNKSGELIDRFFRQNFPGDEPTHPTFTYYYWSLRHSEEQLSNLIRIANKRGIELTCSENLLGYIKQLDQHGIEGFYRGDLYVSTTAMQSLEVNDITPDFTVMLKRLAQTGAVLCTSNNYFEFQFEREHQELQNFINGLKDELDKFFNNVTNRISMIQRASISGEETEDDPDLADNSPIIQDLSNKYREAHRLFLNELKLANQLQEQQIRYRGTRIHCGLSLLKELKLQRAVQEQIQFALENAPDNKALRQIQKELSPYHKIIDFYDKKQYAMALSEIQKLPDADQSSPELLKLIPEIHLNFGLELLNKNDAKGAQAALKKALDSCHTAKLKERVKDHITDFIKEKLNKLGDSDLSKSMEWLETGFAVTRHPGLSSIKGQLSVKYAAKELDQIESKASRSGFRCTEETVNHLRRLMKMMQNSIKSGHSGAKKQHKRAEKLYNEAKCGYLGLPDRYRNTLSKALQSIRLGNFEQAVPLLRKINHGLGSNRSDILNRLLSESLIKLSQQRINQAVDIASAHLSVTRGLKMKPTPPQKALELMNDAIKDIQPLAKQDPGIKSAAEKMLSELQHVLDNIRTGKLPQKHHRAQVVTQTVQMNYYSSLKWMFAAFLFALATIIIILGELKFLLVLFPLLALSVLLGNATHKK